MKNFTLPYISNDKYIDTIVDKYVERTYELFGTDEDLFSGRIKKELVPKLIFNKHITKLLNNDIEFNYLLNSNNLEHYLSIPNKVKDKLKQLRDLNVKFLTVFSPVIQDFVLSLGFDNFKFVNSLVGSEIDTFLKVKQLEKLRYDRIILTENINRDFITLEHLRKSTNLPLELHLNLRCARDCLIRQDHFTKFHVNCKKYCIAQHSILNFLNSPHIYPFELSKYKEVGINFYKLNGRDRNYEDMLDIIHDYITEIRIDSNLLNDDYRFQETTLKYIDNIYLKDFFNFFKTGSGCSRQCNTCKICYKWEEKIKKDLIDINNNPEHPLYIHLH
jgi:hypothetical protein